MADADAHHIAWAKKLLSNDDERHELCDKEFVEADADGTGDLSVDEVVKLVNKICRSMNLILPKKEKVAQLVEACDKSKDGDLQLNEFRTCFKTLLKACLHEAEKETSEEYQARMKAQQEADAAEKAAAEAAEKAAAEAAEKEAAEKAAAEKEAAEKAAAEVAEKEAAEKAAAEKEAAEKAAEKAAAEAAEREAAEKEAAEKEAAEKAAAEAAEKEAAEMAAAEKGAAEVAEKEAAEKEAAEKAAAEKAAAEAAEKEAAEMAAAEKAAAGLAEKEAAEKEAAEKAAAEKAAAEKAAAAKAAAAKAAQIAAVPSPLQSKAWTPKQQKTYDDSTQLFDDQLKIAEKALKFLKGTDNRMSIKAKANRTELFGALPKLAEAIDTLNKGNHGDHAGLSVAFGPSSDRLPRLKALLASDVGVREEPSEMCVRYLAMNDEEVSANSMHQKSVQHIISSYECVVNVVKEYEGHARRRSSFEGLGGAGGYK